MDPKQRHVVPCLVSHAVNVGIEFHGLSPLLLARNIFQPKRAANLQHGIEPTLEQEQDRGISI